MNKVTILSSGWTTTTTQVTSLPHTKERKTHHALTVNWTDVKTRSYDTHCVVPPTVVSATPNRNGTVPWKRIPEITYNQSPNSELCLPTFHCFFSLFRVFCLVWAHKQNFKYYSIFTDNAMLIQQQPASWRCRHCTAEPLQVWPSFGIPN